MHRLWDIGNNFMAQTQNLYALESYLHETLLGSEHRCAAWTGCRQHAWAGCGQHGLCGWAHGLGLESTIWLWTAWAESGQQAQGVHNMVNTSTAETVLATVFRCHHSRPLLWPVHFPTQQLLCTSHAALQCKVHKKSWTLINMAQRLPFRPCTRLPPHSESPLL